jgi:hypothetical protein
MFNIFNLIDNSGLRTDDPFTERENCEIIITGIQTNYNLIYYQYKRYGETSDPYQSSISTIENLKDKDLQSRFKQEIIKYRLNN